MSGKITATGMGCAACPDPGIHHRSVSNRVAAGHAGHPLRGGHGHPRGGGLGLAAGHHHLFRFQPDGQPTALLRRSAALAAGDSYLDHDWLYHLVSLQHA